MLDIVHFPNATQILFLKAALLPQEEAFIAWKKWLQQTGHDGLDLEDKSFLAQFYDPLTPDAWKLTPLIYKNLESFQDPIVARMKGYRRHTWVMNQQLIHGVQAVLNLLNDAGIEHLLFKGIPMASLHYKDMANRAMSDCDILIPYGKQLQVLKLLESMGFSPAGYSIAYTLKHSQAIVLQKKYNNINIQIDIHWNIFYEYAHHPDIDKPFWDKRVVFQHQLIKSYRLSTTHQFFLSIIHGRSASENAPLRWVADAYTIWKNVPDEIDWQELVDLSIRLQFVPFMEAAFQFLKKEFAMPVPDFVLEQLRLAPIAKTAMAYQVSISRNIKLKGAFYLGKELLKRQYYLYQTFKKSWHPQPFIIWLLNWSYSRYKG